MIPVIEPVLSFLFFLEVAILRHGGEVAATLRVARLSMKQWLSIGSLSTPGDDQQKVGGYTGYTISENRDEGKLGVKSRKP